MILSKYLRQCLDEASKDALKLLTLASYLLSVFWSIQKGLRVFDISDHAKRVKCLGNCGNLLLELEPAKSTASG